VPQYGRPERLPANRKICKKQARDKVFRHLWDGLIPTVDQSKQKGLEEYRRVQTPRQDAELGKHETTVNDFFRIAADTATSRVKNNWKPVLGTES